MIPTRSSLEITSPRRKIISRNLAGRRICVPAGTKIRVLHRNTPINYPLGYLEDRHGDLTGYYDPVNDLWGVLFDNHTTQWIPREAFVVSSYPFIT